MAIAPYKENYSKYEMANINLGNNFISLLEIVSSLNFFNLARANYHYNYPNCLEKYNPKVYIGAVQSAALNWNFDRDLSRENLGQGNQKSGSWPLYYFCNTHFNFFIIL